MATIQETPSTQAADAPAAISARRSCARIACAAAAIRAADMKNSINKPAFRLAFCSATAALEVVLMMVTSLVRIGAYALPCFAGLLTIAVVIEYECKWAFGVFGVTAVLSFFLSGDKEAVVMFIALFGYYPILKNILLVVN